MSRALRGDDFLHDPLRDEIDQDYATKLWRVGRFIVPILERISIADTGSETGHFIDERANGDIVDKIQTMVEGMNTAASPRLNFARKTGADELPQLKRVKDGLATLVGTRIIKQECLDRMAAHTPETNETWRKRVYDPYPRALIGIGSLIRRFYPEGHQHTPEVDKIAQEAEIKFFEQVDEKTYINVIRRALPIQLGAIVGLSHESLLDFALGDRPTAPYAPEIWHPSNLGESTTAA